MGEEDMDKNKNNILCYIDVKNPPPHFVVAKDYVFDDIVIPEGFRTDFASLPFILRAIYNRVDETAIAAMVHDYMYRTQKVSRSEADQLFLDIMIAHEVGLFKRELYYWGVRSIGWWSWYRNKATAWMVQKGWLSDLRYKAQKNFGL